MDNSRGVPKVDVIIPAYNAGRYLTAALDSVFAQSFQDWRIVLVNDGSTDNTAQIAEDYAARLGPRMRVVHQKNRGLPAARNAAIQASDGDLLALLDADDIWLPHRLEESVRLMESRPEVGLSYGLITRIDADGNHRETFLGNRHAAEGRVASALYQRLIEIPCPTVTFRRSCVEEVGGFDETMRATEDRDLWLRIAFRHAVGVIPKVIAYYRTSPSSMSIDPDRMLRSQMYFISKHFGQPGCGRIARQRAIARALKQQAEAFSARGDNTQALRSGLLAFRSWPFRIETLRSATSLLIRWVSAPFLSRKQQRAGSPS